MQRLKRPAWFIPLILLAASAVAVAGDWWLCLPEGLTPRYVGRGKCIDCHQGEYKKWHGSDHDLAMDHATEKSVLGDFADVQFDYRGNVSRFSRREGKFYVTTDGPDGKQREYQVKYTFGVRPLQQYLVELDRGRVQALPFCWDTEKNRWFHIYQDDPQTITHRDPLHWTRGGQNWNHMCADCHSTDLHKNYDHQTRTFDTSYSEIDVSCEACHGPGSIHVELANATSIFWDRRYGYGLAKLKGESNEPQIEACARCHSHRGLIHEGFHAGSELLDHYVPALLDTGLYYEDGQIREEVYVHGSFKQSLMYRKGVRCTDCHDPHSARLRFSGNQVCTDCHQHPAGKYDAPAHHHHKQDGPGASCVECHMPKRTYMVVDPRRDHSLRVPRPDLSVLLDTPNACTKCHLEMESAKSTDPAPYRDYAAWHEAARDGDAVAREQIDRWNTWAAENVEEWFPGSRRRQTPHFALTLAAGMRGELEAGAGVDADDPVELRREIVRRLTRLARGDVGPVVRASAVSLLGRYPSVASREANQQALANKDPLVRLAAVRNLESLYAVNVVQLWDMSRMPPASRAAIRGQLEALQDAGAPLLSDPVRAVRVEAARVLAVVGRMSFPKAQREAFDAALEQFEQGCLESADRASALVTLAGAYAKQGRLEKLEQTYLEAVRVQPSFIPARSGLATLYNYQGRNDEAERHLREALEYAPHLADVHYSLGLLLAEDPDRLAEAAEQLGLAAKAAPEQPRYHYNHGLALQRIKQWAKAELELLEAHRLDRTSPEFVNALVHLHREQGNLEEAVRYAELLAGLLPESREAAAQLQMLRQEAAAPQPGPRPPGPQPSPR